MNGTFSLAQPLQVSAAAPSPPVGGSSAPTTIKTWRPGLQRRQSTIKFKQSIGANDPLRTGTYSKTLTFTLSTTQP